MNTTANYHISRLEEEWSKRRQKNNAYSLRSFARDLAIDSSNLSAILKRKRRLPVKRAENFCDLLRLSPRERALFLSSVFRTHSSLDEISVNEVEAQYLNEEMHFKLIAEWEYYAILKLIDQKDYVYKCEDIASLFEITVSRVQTVLEHLTNLDFISFDQDKAIKRLAPRLQTSEDIVSDAIKKFNLTSFDMAKEKIETVPVELRDISSMTLKINMKDLPEIKALIREFQDKLEAFAEAADSEEVYHFGTQLYPLTKIKH
jgi:uncharacterized protein (TIGR02147 family)